MVRKLYYVSRQRANPKIRTTGQFLGTTCLIIQNGRRQEH